MRQTKTAYISIQFFGFITVLNVTDIESIQKAIIFSSLYLCKIINVVKSFKVRQSAGPRKM